MIDTIYCQTSDIRHTLVSNTNVQHSLRCSWSIACRRCSSYIFILDLTLASKDWAKTTRWDENHKFKFLYWVHLILEVWQYCEVSFFLWENQAHSSLMFSTGFWYYWMQYWDVIWADCCFLCEDISQAAIIKIHPLLIVCTTVCCGGCHIRLIIHDHIFFHFSMTRTRPRTQSIWCVLTTPRCPPSHPLPSPSRRLPNPSQHHHHHHPHPPLPRRMAYDIVTRPQVLLPPPLLRPLPRPQSHPHRPRPYLNNLLCNRCTQGK